MSMMGPPQGKTEVGETVASFSTYEAAQKAVSALIAGEVPAREIAIVGQGLRSIERVTGRLGYATAARQGAINGVLLGLLFSAFFVLGVPNVPIQAFVGVLFVGIAIGMLLSILTYSIVRRRRDFASVMQVVADHYEVTVGAASIHRARQVLGTQSSAAPPRTVVARPAPEPAPIPEERPEQPAEPPRYGERVPPSAPVAGPDEPQSPAPEPTGPGEPAPGPDPEPVPTPPVTAPGGDAPPPEPAR